MSGAMRLKVAVWPDRDRVLWERACAPAAGLFGEEGRAAALRPHTRRNYEQSYGDWIGFLVAADLLDPAEGPAARASPARLDAWISARRAHGSATSSIRQGIVSLHAMLRLLEPAAELGFMLRPGGVPLATLLPSPAKPFPPLDSEDVMRRVQTLHAAALAAPPDLPTWRDLRDAALLALLVRRAPRISSVAAMRLGIHLTATSDGVFRVGFPAKDVKTGRWLASRLAYPLDATCGAIMRDYLDRARPHFPGAGTNDHLWAGTRGEPLDAIGLTAIVNRRTLAWFGTRLGPHVFRKWLRSTAARRSAHAAFDAAEVMGHSPSTSLRHYAEANAIGAAARYADTIAAQRRTTESLARRTFDERRRGTTMREESP